MKKHDYLPILLAVSTWLFSAPTVFAQTEGGAKWQIRRQENDILISTRPNSLGPIDEVKGETIIAGNVDSAFASISDIVKFVSTDELVSSTEILSAPKSDKAYIYYYQVNNMPFPLKDRDALMRLKSSKTTQGYFITYESVEDITIKPLVEGKKRMTNVVVYMSLQQVNTGVFKMSYRLVYKGIEGADNPLAVTALNNLMISSTYNRFANLRKLVAPELTAKQ